MRSEQTASTHGHRPPSIVDADSSTEVQLALDELAPGSARSVVAGCLAGRTAPAVIDNAQLLVSELVTNSLRHSGAPASEPVVVRLHLWPDRFRLEVEDGGRDRTIVRRPPDLSGGFGLNLVETLSEGWGVVRAADGSTQVWAELWRAATRTRATREGVTA